MRISWSRWHDPMLSIYLRFAGKDRQKDDPFDDDDYDPLMVPEDIPVMPTPLGLMPIGPASLPSCQFNFWVGHTDFRINEYFRDTVEKIDGVETLDIWTPYRFRVGIGKLFSEEKVLNTILGIFTVTEDSMEQFEREQDILKKYRKLLKSRKAWAIYRTKDKQLAFVYGSSKEQVDRQLKDRGVYAIERSQEAETTQAESE